MPTCCTTTFGVLGLFAVISGIFTFVFYDDLYHYIMKTQMQVKENSYSYDLWKETPIPMYMSVYYFNCTNAQEVMDDKSAKPLLKQVGPYVFKEYHEKTNITFSDDGTRVDFYQKKYWTFDEERSDGTLDDEIWTLNMVAVQAAEATRWPGSWADDDYPFMQYMLGVTIDMYNEELFIKARIGNLTFEGIDSPLLHMADEANGGALGDMLANQIPFDRFGWFYDRNESIEYDGEFRMFTGTDDIYKVGQIDAWKNQTDLSDYYPGECEELTGSAGEFFPQDRDKTTLSYFTPDLCRPIFFTFQEKAKVRGIHGYKYNLAEGFVANSTYNATNECYNPHPDLVPNYYDEDGEYPHPQVPLGDVANLHLPNGLLNVSSCKYNAAAYVSFPHFYMADPILLDQFHPDSDLFPNEEEHESYITILPKQGIPLEVAIRMQINVLYRPITEYVPLLWGREPVFYPAVWFEVISELPDDMANQLRMLEWVPRLGDIIGGICIGLGALTVILTGAVWSKNRSKHQYV